MAGALLFDQKICQSVVLFKFGLRDVLVFFLQIFFSQAVIQRTDASAHDEAGAGAVARAVPESDAIIDPGSYAGAVAAAVAI